MHRIAPLVSFSHDHHHALSRARRLKRAGSGDDTTRREAADAFLAFFEHETLAHFRDEEELLFPAAMGSTDPSLHQSVATALVEHAVLRHRTGVLRSLLDQGETPTAGLLEEVAALLTDHVRHEERVLFMQLQAALTPEQVSLAVGDRTTLDQSHDALRLKSQRSAPSPCELDSMDLPSQMPATGGI